MVRTNIMKYNIIRLISTLEIPIIYLILSMQTSDPFWKNVWLTIATLKFVVNAAYDILAHIEREKHIKALEDYTKTLKKRKK
jgi:UDP-N-acetylglucosamine pyrophosphorylase|tara:strand:+ start:901 stop:1146 length:246 start_codon:yes stop_codon:yes gene_type:complete